MLMPDFGKKGLFVFSDPGGAKPILSYILLNNLEEHSFVISDRVYDFYSDFPLSVNEFLGDVEAVIQDVKPDYLFTGTSYTSKIEMQFIKAAKRKGIETYSFIDYYTNFKERFHLQGDEHVYPDHICVIDAKAENIAKKILTESIITNTGNFYHAYLKCWQPTRNKESFFNQLQIPLSKKLLVFAPDPLSNVDGEQKTGLDENTVWLNLANALFFLEKENYLLIIKLHPNQKKEKILPLIYQNKNIEFRFADDLHTNTLLYHADAIIGMFSNILIESSILHRQVIRCLIGLTGVDPLKDKGIGYVVNNQEELENLLKKIVA